MATRYDETATIAPDQRVNVTVINENNPLHHGAKLSPLFSYTFGGTPSLTEQRKRRGRPRGTHPKPLKSPSTQPSVWAVTRKLRPRKNRHSNPAETPFIFQPTWKNTRRQRRSRRKQPESPPSPFSPPSRFSPLPHQIGSPPSSPTPSLHHAQKESHRPHPPIRYFIRSRQTTPPLPSLGLDDPPDLFDIGPSSPLPIIPFA
jgi:hypothetical protein